MPFPEASIAKTHLQVRKWQQVCLLLYFSGWFQYWLSQAKTEPTENRGTHKPGRGQIIFTWRSCCWHGSKSLVSITWKAMDYAHPISWYYPANKPMVFPKHRLWDPQSGGDACGQDSAMQDINWCLCKFYFLLLSCWEMVHISTMTRAVLSPWLFHIIPNFFQRFSKVMESFPSTSECSRRSNFV